MSGGRNGRGLLCHAFRWSGRGMPRQTSVRISDLSIFRFYSLQLLKYSGFNSFTACIQIRLILVKLKIVELFYSALHAPFLFEQTTDSLGNLRDLLNFNQCVDSWTLELHRNEVSRNKTWSTLENLQCQKRFPNNFVYLQSPSPIPNPFAAYYVLTIFLK